MKYAIYQIKDIRNTMYAFRGWEEAESIFNIDDYKKVYEGEMEQKNILDKLWEIFNVNHPDDFRGHSMSVSDVIALKKDDKDYWYWYYCDSFGWKEITEMIPKEFRDNPEKERTFTITETVLKNLVTYYAYHKLMCEKYEEEIYGDVTMLRDYHYNLGCSNAAETWIRALGISMESDFVQDIINKERK